MWQLCACCLKRCNKFEITHNIMTLIFVVPVGFFPNSLSQLPLISGRLLYVDCLPLLKRVTTHVRSWSTQGVVLCSRLPLIHYVLQSFQVYWANVLFYLQKLFKTLIICFTPIFGTGSWTVLAGLRLLSRTCAFRVVRVVLISIIFHLGMLLLSSSYCGLF